MPRGRPKGSKNKPKNAGAVSAFNSATPAQRATMISSLTRTINYKKPIGPKRRATAAQLAALANARAARAGRRAGGAAVPVAAAAGNAAGVGLIGGIRNALGI